MKNEIYRKNVSIVIITLFILFICNFSTKVSYANENNDDNSNYNLFFGQIHMHSQNSACGTGSVDKAYSYARDTGKLDFMVLTDHSNDFDNGSKGNILDGSCSKEWTSGHEIADKYTDENFVAMYGYEMTWSNGNGHMNTYNTKGFESRDNYSNTQGTTKGVDNYYKTLKDKAPEAICQINHPNQGTFGDFDYYDKEIDNIVNLIEVGRGMGLINGKGTCTSSSKWERMEKYYYEALDKGWHLAPTAGQDDHSSKWGTTNPARTVVLCDKLTRDNIYDALKNRRCYASEDNDLEIKYTLDNKIMGSITGKISDTSQITVNYKETSNDKIDKIRIMVDGQKEIASKTVDNSEGTITFEVPSKYSYYVVEVYEQDNDFAITAPVWIDNSIEVSKDLYIDNIMTSLPSGIKLGSSVTLSGSVKNNKDNVKYRYSLKDKNGNVKVIQDYSEKNTIEWTPTASGQYAVVLDVQDSQSKATKEINYIVKDNTTISTIYYEGYNCPYIHYKINGKWTTSPGMPMVKSDDVSGYSYKAEVDLGDAEEMIVCFNDGNGNWDSNSPNHYVFGTGYYTFSKGIITEIANPNITSSEETDNKDKSDEDKEVENKDDEDKETQINNNEEVKKDEDKEVENKDNEETKNEEDKKVENKDNEEIKNEEDKKVENKDNEEIKNEEDKEVENKDNEEIKNEEDKKVENKDNEEIKNDEDKEAENKDNEEIKNDEDKEAENKDNEEIKSEDKQEENINATTSDRSIFSFIIFMIILSGICIKYTQKQ